MEDNQSADARRIGVICGGGEFPRMVVEGARRAGNHVIVIGLRGLADPGLANIADEFCWTGIVRLGQWIRILRRRQCNRVILAGAVNKTDLHNFNGLKRILYFRPDWTTFRLWFFRVEDMRADTILGAVADVFAKRGIIMENCIEYTQDSMAWEGFLTARRTTPAQDRDIEFGWRIAKEMGRLDIGQSIAVRDRDVIAVEAIEGTDGMIERAGRLCKAGGWCHIKVSKPDQDMRFDVPTIGPQTIETLHKNGAGVLCVEAGKTLIVDRAKMLQLAERYGIVIVGRRDIAGNAVPVEDTTRKSA